MNRAQRRKHEAEVDKRRRKLISDFNAPRLRHDMAYLRERGFEFFFTVDGNDRLVGDDGQELDHREVGMMIHQIAATKAHFVRQERIKAEREKAAASLH